ncbi:MAG TPA: D-glycerate dehydrogenase [Candidatus Binataceae bacterium]|nr:D-glycerate dehydrogenase [Candidatus Binataceae bacterium]
MTRTIAASALAQLAQFAQVDLWSDPLPPPPAALRAHLALAQGVLTMVTDRLDAEVLRATPHLRAISQMAVGTDNIDLAAAAARGIPVGHTPGVLTETTAELAFALLMAVARRVVEADRYVRAGNWQTWGPDILLGRDLYGATLGIIGMGKIGTAMARRGRGFGMRILYNNPAPVKLPDEAEFLPLNELLQRADFISLHAPLTAATRGLIGPAQFALMKPGAILVNTARGEEIVEPALVQALASGRLGGAGLDVTAREPLDSASPLLSFPNVVITPHIGSASVATRQKMAEMAVDNLREGLAGRRPRWCANAAQLP